VAEQDRRQIKQTRAQTQYDKKRKKRERELETESRKRARKAAAAEDDKLFDSSGGEMSEGNDFINQDFRDDKEASSSEDE
jgi:hypothetical protein